MKKLIIILSGLLILGGCDSNFNEINTDPNIINNPPLEAVFTYVEKRLGDYKGSEWYWDNHQFLLWAQYLSGDDGNANDINILQPRGGRYSVFYTDILSHLVEIRRQIGLKTEDEQAYYKKLTALTYIIQVFHGLRVTDIYGSIPYTEAALGRREGKLDPVYDTQSALYNNWINELNNAISVLDENQEASIDMSKADFIYHGDWDKWVKCANAIKLRIALRLENQDLDKAKSIISEVVSDGRLIESMDDEFTYYISDNWRGTFGASMDWKGRLWASKPMVDFMKKTVDPRLRIFFEPNGYHRATIDAINNDPNAEMPPVIDTLNDNQVLYTSPNGEEILGYRYIGAPVDRNDPNKNDYVYIENPTSVGINATQISKFNQRLLMNVTKNYGDGVGEGAYVDVFISQAEVAFMMAEFILKNYISGSAEEAEEWYMSGVKASLRTYSFIGEKGKLDFKISGVSYPYLPISADEIAAYLQKPEIQFDGTNDLEKVYIQEHLNFYRLPGEGWMFAMRTGYPKFGSSLLARGHVDDPDLKFPRRMPTPDPGDLNRENWRAANNGQGFTELDETPEVLNSQRLWWDLNNPAIGEGN